MFDLTDEQKQSLVREQPNPNAPTPQVAQSLQNRGLTPFDSTNKNAFESALSEGKDLLALSEASSAPTQENTPQEPKLNFIPTGVSFIDAKLSQGKGLNFLESYIAHNFLGINISGHLSLDINQKQDQKTRNMTGLYNELARNTRAIDAIDKLRASDLKAISGYSGALKNGITTLIGKQWDQATEEARTNMLLAINELTTALKIPGVTGKDNREQIEQIIYKALTDETTRNRALVMVRDTLSKNNTNIFRTIEQMGGDPSIRNQYAQWYSNAAQNHQELNQKWARTNDFDKDTYERVNKRIQSSPMLYLDYAQSFTQPQGEIQ